MPDETIRIVTSDIPGESPQLVTADGGKTAQPAPHNSTSIEQDVPLKSERGVDYTKLRDLLATGKLQEADEETSKKMLEVAGRKELGWLIIEDIDRFPCEDLRAIDWLWVKYSNGRFGFSVKVWEEPENIMRKFGRLLAIE